MGLLDELKGDVVKIFRSQWELRKGLKVPSPEDLKLGNDAAEFERATVLYADLSGSTEMVNSNDWRIAAEIYKAFLICAAKIVRSEGGQITSYDGDRIMGLFIGDSQSTSAATCGLKINYAVVNVINPAFSAQYPSNSYTVRQVVGIDTSHIRAARTGVRGDNDIVWVGRAANYAAKLTNIDLEQRTWITKDVYDILNKSAKFGGERQENMWKQFTWTANKNMEIYGSTWWWRVEG
jgi:class 3 adenylate cyclase